MYNVTWIDTHYENSSAFINTMHAVLLGICNYITKTLQKI